MSRKIVLLCTDADSSRAIYNALKEKFGEVRVVVENPMSRITMAVRRAKRLGYVKVAGQIMFVLFAVPLLSRLARRRITEINSTANLKYDWNGADITRVETVNSGEARTVLKELEPSLIIVNGTRIISKKTLASVDAVFINTHAGITPMYRGVHGGYWALAEGKPELVGTTVHLLDHGIDTGDVVDQVFFEISPEDNFATYPYLHTASGIPALLKAVDGFLDGELCTKDITTNENSKLWHHPTLWGYLTKRIRMGVK